MHASCLPILRMPLASPPAACVVASLSTWCVKPTNYKVWQLGAVARLDAADLGEGELVNEPLNQEHNHDDDVAQRPTVANVCGHNMGFNTITLLEQACTCLQQAL